MEYYNKKIIKHSVLISEQVKGNCNHSESLNEMSENIISLNNIKNEIMHPDETYTYTHTQ
jgi:hypothetical protein